MGRFRDKKNNFTNGENYGHQKMNLINPSREKNQKSWILKTVYGKHSIYFSDFKKKINFSDGHVATRFCDKRNYVTTRKNYGCQKINLNIQEKKIKRAGI